MKQLKTILAASDLSDNADRAIKRAALATELDSELVAVGTEGFSGLPFLLLGSVTEHVMRQAPCDVLAVRPSAFSFRLP